MSLGDERFDIGDVFFGGKIARAFIKASDLTGELIEALLKSSDALSVLLEISLTQLRLSVSVGTHGGNCMAGWWNCQGETVSFTFRRNDASCDDEVEWSYDGIIHLLTGELIMGMEKAIASLVMGVVGILAVYGIDVSAGIVQTVIVVLSTAAVYVVPNSTKKKAS